MPIRCRFIDGPHPRGLSIGRSEDLFAMHERSSCTVASGCCFRHPKACMANKSDTSYAHTKERSHARPQVTTSVTTAPCGPIIASGWLRGDLPWRMNDIVAGVNGQRKVVPKRNWARGGISGSVSRHMQHTFMWEFVDKLQYNTSRVRARSHSFRCLDWDGWYGGSIFKSVCSEVDVVVYEEPFGRVPTKPLPRIGGSAAGAARTNRLQTVRWWHADAHSFASILPHDAFDLVIANSVFEHIERPFEAMRQLYLLLRPGGRLFWHTPFYYEMHGVPNDYYRFTVEGARRLAVASGLDIEYSTVDGGVLGVLASVLGLSAKFWSTAELRAGTDGGAIPERPRSYLSTRMVATKPAFGDKLPRSEAAGGAEPQQHVHRTTGGDADGLRPKREEKEATCAPASSPDFAMSVRRAWQGGGLPLLTSNNGSALLMYLRHRFWRRLARGSNTTATKTLGAAKEHAAVKVGGRRCLHWAPLSESASDAGVAALRRMCDELTHTPTLGKAIMVAGERGGFDTVLTSAAFARVSEPQAAMQQVAALLAARSGRLVWHEPFSRADQGDGDLWRFTTSAARYLANSSGLAVTELSADGGYGAVLGDVIGLPPTDCHFEATGLARGAESSTRRGSGHYLATAMVAVAHPHRL